MHPLASRIVTSIEQTTEEDFLQGWEPERFERLARELFAHQFEHNEPYRSLCKSRGVTPDSLEHSHQLPAVPTDAFKHARLTGAEPARVFRTSGTTRDRRGEHLMGESGLATYRASLHPSFRHFLLPDTTGPVRILVLAPSSRELPDSSLSFMLEEIVDRYGDEHSGFFVGVEPGSSSGLSFRFEQLAEQLDRAEQEEVVTLVLGTAFGFVAFFDACPPRSSWELAPGSRLMETGGFKGKTREIGRSELYQRFSTILGIPASMCISEYSMTELSSQSYTRAIRESLRSDGIPVGAPDERALFAPPWARIEVVDPLSLIPRTEPGASGLIRWIDLANFDSVLAIQTSDRGRLTPAGGCQLLGRASGSELRGCSLTIEEILEQLDETEGA